MLSIMACHMNVRTPGNDIGQSIIGYTTCCENGLPSGSRNNGFIFLTQIHLFVSVMSLYSHNVVYHDCHMNVIMYLEEHHQVITPGDNKGQSNILDA